jgi:hydrogenase maturation protein HypF
VPFRAYEADGGLRIDWGDAFRRLADPEVQEGRVAAWALAVHEAVARAALAMTEYAAARSPLRAIALSGGVFMNRILTGRLAPALERMGFRVCIHRQVPPNDGGIALGQTIAAGS